MSMRHKIGVIADSYRVGVYEGLLRAQKAGADGVQLYAVSGELDPDHLTSAARREWKERIAALGLEISALVGDLGGHGFQNDTVNAQKIAKSKRILDLAVDLGARIVTTHIGIVPEETDSRIYASMHDACAELSAYAQSLNAYFAIETGPEPAERLKSFLDGLGAKGVAVNYDPANLVMITGDDPVRGVYTLQDYIVHTHAKDGIRLRDKDVREIYGFYGYKKPERNDEHLGKSFKEVPLGEGSVDWNGYLQALEDIGYAGYLTIEREVGDDPEADIAHAVRFIRRLQEARP